MDTAANVATQLAFLPVALVMMIVLCLAVGFLLSVLYCFERDVWRGIGNLRMAAWAERTLDKEEKKNRKVARKAAAIEAALRRRAKGSMQE